MFKVGQKVACKNPYDTDGLIKGKIYTIIDVFYCGCGEENIIVHNLNICGGTICPKCRHESYGYNFYKSSRFEPLKYDLISNKDIIKEIITERLDIPVKELEPTN